MSDTIIQNICFGKDVDLERVKKCAQLACASDFIEKMSDKYESMLSSRGTNLSGGQKQRILLARALYANPDIFILDDSSSALDMATEAKLQNAIKTNMTDSTVFIIAQRISGVMDADKIIVMDEGQIVDIGTHEELLQSSEIYRSIAVSQLGEEVLENV
jgi:ATP-binding cassette subfamily B protein